MVCNKGKYCPIRQYLPSEPTKWVIKVWCLVDVMTSYVYKYEVNNGANLRRSLRIARLGEDKTRYDVVMNLSTNLHGHGRGWVGDLRCRYGEYKLHRLARMPSQQEYIHEGALKCIVLSACIPLVESHVLYGLIANMFCFYLPMPIPFLLKAWICPQLSVK